MGMARGMGLQRPINGVITDLGRAALRRTGHTQGGAIDFTHSTRGIWSSRSCSLELGPTWRFLPTFDVISPSPLIFLKKEGYGFSNFARSLTPSPTQAYFLCMEHLLYAASSLVKQPIWGNKMRQ